MLKIKSLFYYFSSSNISYNVLVFIVLITQSSIPVKVLGLAFFVIFNSKSFISPKTNTLQLFYLAILSYTLIYGLFFVSELLYLTVLIMSLIFWLISLLVLRYISAKVNSLDYEKLKNTVIAFFLLNLLIMIYQYISIAVVFGSINPYAVSAATGDYIMGIFSNSSVCMMIMSLLVLFFLFQREYMFLCLTIIGILATTYMSGLFIFIVMIMIGFLFFGNIRMGQKVVFLIAALSFLAIFAMVSPDNVTYAEGYLVRIYKMGNDVPFKIKSFFQTFSYWTDSLRNFIFGAGPGRFSSRAAFIASGDYVEWFPKKLFYTATPFKANHFSIWTFDFNNPWDNRNNTANQPFSFYNQLLGEYGFIGLLLFVLFYLGFLWRMRKWLTYGIYSIFALLGFLILDYWFEYFSVIVVFEWLILMDIKQEQHDLSFSSDRRTY